jgi:GT2 family glycosyltransferase
MSVFVGIVSKNRRRILPSAVDSALSQEGVTTIVSVYDDNSSDDTRTLQQQYPQVSWYFGDTNRGYVYARNKLMREATAQYFCSLDDDSWFTTPTDLSIAIAYMETHADVAAVAFDIISPDRPDRQPVRTPVETANFIGCGHVLRLSHVREVNYYDTNPSFYGGEEKDLCIKLMDKGYKIVSLPGVHVWHDKTTLSRDMKAQHRSGVCNDLVFAYRRTPARVLVPALMSKVISHVRFAMRYEGGAFLQSSLLAMYDFGRLVITFKLARAPVKMTTLQKFRRLSQI